MVGFEMLLRRTILFSSLLDPAINIAVESMAGHIAFNIRFVVAYFELLLITNGPPPNSELPFIGETHSLLLHHHHHLSTTSFCVRFRFPHHRTRHWCVKCVVD